MDQPAPQHHRSNGFRNFLVVASLVWLLLCTGLPLMKISSPETKIPWLILIYCGFTVICSIIAFIAYGIDKRRARKISTAFPKRDFTCFLFLGGWPGSYLAQQLFRHKTRKVSFRLVFWVIVLLHLGIIGYGIYLWIKIS